MYKQLFFFTTLLLLPLAAQANADLFVQTVQAQQGTIPPPFAQGAVEIEFVVINIGNQAAINFWIEGYSGQSTSCFPLPSRLEGSIKIARLEAGASISGTFVIHSRDGDVQIFGILKADTTNVVPENNENNNCKASLAVNVRYPDLQVPGITGPNPNRITPGGDGVVFDATIKNVAVGGAGNGWPADASIARYYLSTASTNPPLQDLLPDLGLTQALAINEQTTIRKSIALAKGTPLGNYNLFVMADGQNDVIERNETNNFGPPRPIEVVDLCTVADVDGDGLVTILDFVALVSGATALVDATNQHLDLKRSSFPFPDLINRLDLLAALPCFGSFQFDSEASGNLSDFQVIAAPGGGFEVAADIAGQVSAINVYVKTPLGFPLTAAFPEDALNTSNTQSLLLADGAMVLANEYQTTFNSTSILTGQSVLASFAATGIDLTQTAPLLDPSDFTSGVAVTVAFGDGTSQTLVKRFAFADIPDPQFRAHVSSLLGQGSNDPIGDQQIAGITTLEMDQAGIADLTGIRRFTGLNSLSCQFNNLTSLPDLSALTQLQTLVAVSNQLTEPPLLPASLKYLYLGWNQLMVPPVIDHLNGLLSLDLTHNQITYVPDLIGFNQLFAVYLYDNRIGTLPQLPASVTHLLASNNLLSTLPDMSANLFEYCDLADNYLYELGNLPTASWLPGSSLLLANNNLDESDCSAINLLKPQTSLSYLPQRTNSPCQQWGK